MIDFPLRAALFDLDGVIFDTEAQYSIFWGGVCREYHPEQPGLENRIKGQTLTQIMDAHFSANKEMETSIIERLDQYEAKMDYVYVDGFPSFVKWLRANGIATAVVTSSNISKMECVYRKHPEFKSMIDIVLTAESFEKSKPAPDCYLKAAECLGVENTKCMVFEDSLNGLHSGLSAGMAVVGLATTNPSDLISPLCDIVIKDFTLFDETLCRKAYELFKKRS